MTAPLPPAHSLSEVAAALHETERYVADKCRAGEWPYSRGARGRMTFTDAQFAQILEIRAVPVAAQVEPRWALAPRSRKTA